MQVQFVILIVGIVLGCAIADYWRTVENKQKENCEEILEEASE